MVDTMKLYAVDNSDLMEIKSIYSQGDNLMIDGTIMGAMPIRAIIKPAEVRKAMGLMTFRTKWNAFKMIFKSSR